MLKSSKLLSTGVLQRLVLKPRQSASKRLVPTFDHWGGTRYKARPSAPWTPYDLLQRLHADITSHMKNRRSRFL